MTAAEDQFIVKALDRVGVQMFILTRVVTEKDQLTGIAHCVAYIRLCNPFLVCNC